MINEEPSKPSDEEILWLIEFPPVAYLPRVDEWPEQFRSACFGTQNVEPLKAKYGKDDTK